VATSTELPVTQATMSLFRTTSASGGQSVPTVQSCHLLTTIRTGCTKHHQQGVQAGLRPPGLQADLNSAPETFKQPLSRCLRRNNRAGRVG